MSIPVHVRVDGLAPIEQACLTGSRQIFVDVFQAGEVSLEDGSEEGGRDLLCRLIAAVAKSRAWDVDPMLKFTFALDHGQSVDERSSIEPYAGDPAIVMAARLKQYRIVDLLIEKGADVFAQTSNGWDLIMYSIAFNRIDLFRQLHAKTDSASGYDWKARVEFTFIPPRKGMMVTFFDCSVLHLAASSAAVDIIDFLFSHDLVDNVDNCTKQHFTPLQIASFTGDVETIKCLVRHGATLDGVNNKSRRPIEIARRNGRNEAVEALHILGAEEYSTPTSISTSSDDANRWTRHIEYYIEDDMLDEVQELFSEGHPVDCPMPTCGICDALTYAIFYAKSDIAVWLLSIGAIPRQAECSFHQTSGTLHQAATEKITLQCLSQLLDRALESGYAWCNCPMNPLHLACLLNDMEAFKLIVDHLSSNAELYCTSISPWKDQEIPPKKAAMMTALTGVATPPGLHLVGDDGSHSAGATALHLAAFNSHLPKATALIKSGADVNSLNLENQTPLIVAVLQSDDDCALVEFLLDHGALIDHKDVKGLSAMAHAARHDFIHVARLLKERGASLETKDRWGESLMHISSIDSLRCFIYFHQHGCDAEAISLRGHTIFNTRDPRILIYILNAGLTPHTDCEDGLNLISAALSKFGARITRILYRSLPKEARQRLLNNLGDNPPYLSPLCAAISLKEHHDTLPWLLEEGVDIEREVSEEGTALMYACSLGYLTPIKTLVRKRARLEYVDSKGRYRSAILSARQYPYIIRWLLVERFQDQPKLV